MFNTNSLTAFLKSTVSLAKVAAAYDNVKNGWNSDHVFNKNNSAVLVVKKEDNGVIAIYIAHNRQNVTKQVLEALATAKDLDEDEQAVYSLAKAMLNCKPQLSWCGKVHELLSTKVEDPLMAFQLACCTSGNTRVKYKVVDAGLNATYAMKEVMKGFGI